MRYVFDAGALIAADRDDSRLARALKLAARDGIEITTVAPVVGQVWRNGATQARLSRTLKLINVQAVDLGHSKDAGELLAKAGMTDVVDALVALAARPGDQIFTSDVEDITALLAACQVPANIIKC